jgi:hypothetical protein
MNQRSRIIWLPGLVMLTASSGLLSILIRSGVEPFTFFLTWHHPLQFYIPWLITLPFLGALGAYAAQRLGGAKRERFLVGIFPAACILAMIIFGFLAELVVDVGSGRHSIWHALCGFGVFVLCWALVPGMALLLGTLPFLRGDSGRAPHGTPRVTDEEPKHDTPIRNLKLFWGKWRVQGA